MKKALIIAGLLVVGLILTYERETTHGPGVLAPNDPVQTKIERAGSFPMSDFRVIPQADFSLEARVLSRKTYGYGRESELSPIDFALGWGQMSDESVIDKIKIWQSGRWYNWRAKELPIPAREISNHSANMHLIPADDDLKKQLKKVRKGDIVRLTGKLVNVEADDGWRWRSSLTRTDRGNGACEIFYVESVSLANPVD